MKKTPAKTPAGVKKKIDDAVHAYRLYIGSHGYVRNAKAEQKLYDRAAKKAESAAIAWLKSMGEEVTGWTIANAEEQISREASRLGGIRPIPGKDY